MKVGIIGYGKMGQSAFNLFDAAGFDLAVVVRTPQQAARCQDRYARRLERRVRQGIAVPGRDEARNRKILFSTDPAVLTDCGFIIECLPEDFDLKAGVLGTVESLVAPDAVIASNTSSFSLARLAGALARGERFCGFHFINPVLLTSTIEIIRWDGLSSRALEIAADVSARLGRRPLIVKDCPGSVLNPIIGCYSCEALYILEQGLALPGDIDRLAEREFRVGPCEALDTVGIAFFRDVFDRTSEIRPPNIPLPALVPKLLADGRTGRDAGRGVFLYSGESPGQSPLDYYVDPGQRHSPGPSRGKDCLERLNLVIMAATLFILSLGRAEADDLDFGVQDALGMTEGPVARMRKLGRDGLRGKLERFRREVGPRFDPELADHLP